MTLTVYEQSVGLFVRGLHNLKAQLRKAEAAGGDEATLLGARLSTLAGNPAPADLHAYTLAAQVHWAAEAAKLAVAHLLGEPTAPAVSAEASFAELHAHLDATITYLQGIAASELEAGLEREVVIERPRGAVRARGSQFLVAFAIPHFYYHLTTAYGILRNQGVPLTMGDFLGNWGSG